ncbi:MAG: SpoIIE family protein phosphatase [Acidobacteriota bacterium]
MRIRHRLTLAFFVLSVVPLAAVTGYSYYSSAAALRRAAAAQADQMAADMGQRMTWVLADLGHRVQQVWRAQPGSPPAPGRSDTIGTATPGTRAGRETATVQTSRFPADLQARVQAALAEAAPMVERLVFMAGPGQPEPSAPPPDAQAPGPQPLRPPRRPGGMPAPETPPSRVVVDVTVPTKPRRPRARGAVVPFEPPSREALDSWRRAIQQQADLEQQVRANGAAMARIGDLQQAAQARDLARQSPNERRRAEARERLKALAAGEAVKFPVFLDGAVVGEVDATVNRHRMIETVLGLARRDRGEVPFVLDIDDEIHTVGPDDAASIELLKLDRRALAALPGQASRTIGDWVVVTRHDESGIVFGIARPLADSLRDMRLAAVRSLGLGTLLIVGLFGVIAPLASRLTRHVTSLTDGVRRLGTGERGARVRVQSNDEIGELAAAFNRMAGELEAHERALVERERLRRELELCRQIQVDMLPHGPLRLGLAEVTGVSIPAREVGGDFFNYFALADGRIALLVGDVSGKGVGAALLMANIQATLRARLPLEPDLPSLVDAVDEDVAANTPPEVYLTLFVGVLDAERRELRYVNGGHNPQFVLRAGGTLESLAATGLPVGLLPGRGYEERTVGVEPGDLLFLYTDGAVEVENEAGDTFGSARLQQALSATAAADVAGVLSEVESTIRAFRGVAEPSDDATMLALRIGSAPAPPPMH